MRVIKYDGQIYCRCKEGWAYYTLLSQTRAGRKQTPIFYDNTYSLSWTKSYVVNYYDLMVVLYFLSLGISVNLMRYLILYNKDTIKNENMIIQASVKF